MPVDSSRINPMIMESLEKWDIPLHLKGFLRDILMHERGKLDQEKPHYKAEYENLLNKYVEEEKKQISDQ